MSTTDFGEFAGELKPFASTCFVFFFFYSGSFKKADVLLFVAHMLLFISTLQKRIGSC